MQPKPTWLIERGVYRQHAAPFAAEVSRQGMKAFEVDYRPGREPPYDIGGGPLFPEDACIVHWGTLPLMQQIQLRRKWRPGGWCNVEKLDCAAYYPHFRRYLLNVDFAIATGEEALRRQEELFAEFGIDDEIFVRPSGVHKIFAGKIAYQDDFREAIAPARYDPATKILVSSPKEVEREWRLVVVGSETVASSQYKAEGSIELSRGAPREVLEFAANALQQVTWRPDEAFVMDVGQSSGDCGIIELNSFSCSGFYECDLAAIISAASRLAGESASQI